jgi:hemerythrin-like metal-binding protein
MSIIPQKIDWDEKFSVNVKELDIQHQRLISYINELIDALRVNSDLGRIKELKAKLVASETEHFATEEKYFIKFD